MTSIFKTFFVNLLFVAFIIIPPYCECMNKSSTESTLTTTTDVREKRNLHNYGVGGGVSPQFSSNNFNNHHHHHHQQQPQYQEAPEPIIEIIIQDNNETLPPPEPILMGVDGKPKKEQVQVFYVKYKKDDNNQLVIENPVAALSPHGHEQQDENDDQHDHHQQITSYVTPAPPRRSTTLRTIIRPDSKTYESNSGVHVTFDHPDNYNSKSDKHVGDASDKIENIATHPRFAAVPKEKRNSQQQQFFGTPNTHQQQPNLNANNHHHNFPPQQQQQQQQIPPQDIHHHHRFNPQNFHHFQQQPQQSPPPPPTNHYQNQQQFRQQQQQQNFNRPPIVQQQQQNFIPNQVKFPQQQPNIYQQQPQAQPQVQQYQQQQQVKNFQPQQNPHFQQPNYVQHQLPPHFNPQQQFKPRPQQNPNPINLVTQQQPEKQVQVQPNIKYHHPQQQQPQQQQPNSIPFNHHAQLNGNIFQGGLVQQSAPNLVNKQHQQHQQQQVNGHHNNNLIKSTFGGEVVQVQPSQTKFEHHITEQLNTPIFGPSHLIDMDKLTSKTTQQQQQQRNNLLLSEQQQNKFPKVSNLFSDVFPPRQHQQQQQLALHSNVNEKHHQQQSTNFDINNYRIPVQTTARNYPIEVSTTTTVPTTVKRVITTTTTTERPTVPPPPAAIAQLPDEVPDDLREQLLSSGILQNAQISILDYDKIGSTNLQDLPPDHLEHFFSAGGGALAGSNKVLSVARPDEKHVKKDTGVRVKPVVKSPQATEDTKKSKYSRYESFKISGDNFPLPDIDELKNRIAKKVVILVPISEDEDDNENLKRQKINGDEALRNLLRKQSSYNFEQWIKKEEKKNPEDQSVILLLTFDIKNYDEDIFMYDITARNAHRLDGELSRKFIKMAKDISNNDESGEEVDASPSSSEIVESYLKPEASKSEEVVINSGYSNIKS